MPTAPAKAHPTLESRTLLTHPEISSQKSFPVFRTLGEPRKNALERVLSVFADVRAGEGVGVVLLTLNVFLLLALYSLLKPARSGLILTEGGARVASYSSAAQAVLLLGAVPLFGWLASRVPRMKLIVITTLFFASNLVIFYLFGVAGVREGVAFYIWLGIFNLFIVSQFWAFANDLYTEGQGRRLFPFIGVGASLGAWIGATSVEPLVRDAGFTPYTLMLVGGVGLLVPLGITIAVNARETRRADPIAARLDQTPLGKQGGFELVLGDRYLLWIAVLVVLLNVVNSTGEFLLNSLLEESAISTFGADDSRMADRRAYVTGFSGSVQSNVNLVGLLLQLFVSSRVLKAFGVRGTLFVLPLIALVNYSIIAVAPILAVVRVGKVLENGTDYSIQNTLKQALFLPVSREAKYKAKAAIDTFCQRLGDVSSAGAVAVGSALAVGPSAFAWVNVGLTAGWLVVAGRIAKEHRRKTI